MNDPKMIIDYAMQCGAIYAGVDNLALHKDRKAIAASFPHSHDAEEFVYHVWQWLDDRGFEGLQVTHDEEFVLIWL